MPYGACSVENLDTRTKTGKFDLNTLCVDVKIFESAEKKLRIQKYQSGVDSSPYIHQFSTKPSVHNYAKQVK